MPRHFSSKTDKLKRIENFSVSFLNKQILQIEVLTFYSNFQIFKCWFIHITMQHLPFNKGKLFLTKNLTTKAQNTLSLNQRPKNHILSNDLLVIKYTYIKT